MRRYFLEYGYRRFLKCFARILLALGTGSIVLSPPRHRPPYVGKYSSTESKGLIKDDADKVDVFRWSTRLGSGKAVRAAYLKGSS